MPHAPSTGRPSPRRAALAGALLGSILALGACAVTTTTANPPAANVFFAQITQTGVTGRYDPAGFDAVDVQKAMNETCAIRGSLVDYVEQPVAGGMAFTARCRGGTDVRLGTVSVHRYGDRARVRLPGFVELYRENEVVRTISL